MRLLTCLLAASLFASPVLAQEAVHDAYRAALAESPTPTLLRLSQDDWLKQWSQYPDERADMEEARREELQGLAARDRSIRADRIAPADLARVCVRTLLMNCAIENSGSLTLADGTTLWFQQQTGFTDEDGTSTAMVVLQADAARLKPIFWLSGPLGVLPLAISRDGEEDDAQTYVVLPAYGQGTGSHWVGTMFRWNGEAVAPTEIDVQSWLDSLETKLPEGLGVWKGPQFHWDWLSAESPLWQESDANCCATGGDAFFELQIQGDTVVVSDVTVRDAILTVAENVEPDVLGWLSRRAHCVRWAGEEPYDDARRETIAAAAQRLGCDTLEADEAALRVAYADDSSTLALLNRAKAQE